MTTEETDLDRLLSNVRSIRVRREELQADLDSCMRTSRQLAIRLIFDHGFTLGKTATLTGHMRPTLRVWASLEAAKRGDEGLTSHVRD